MSETSTTASAPDTSEVAAPWYAVYRAQAFRGEERVNAIRVAGILLFYALHLANLNGISFGPIQLEAVEGVREIHAAITAIVAGWLAVPLIVVVALRSRRFPRWFSYLTTAFDIVFLTCTLLVADGPSSAVCVAYFVLLAGSVLRFQAALVRFTTVGCMLGYGLIAGQATLYREAVRVPRYEQLMFLIALGLVGGVLSRMLISVREAAEHYRTRVLLEDSATGEGA